MKNKEINPNPYKIFLNKTVRLKYRVNGYLHDQYGVITKVNRELLFFQPFDLDAHPIVFNQIIEINEV